MGRYDVLSYYLILTYYLLIRHFNYFNITKRWTETSGFCYYIIFLAVINTYFQ